ncbi:MAG TPA: hypothetical protein VEW68_06040, partial [Patescibacteria group bacterium]|nr:hypothetical protein [Patescibacteria group bacterium]
EIVAWRRPSLLRYRWRIATGKEKATDVEIQFRPAGRARTRIEIEHGGWDRLGELGRPWREANHSGWDGVLPSYREAARS